MNRYILALLFFMSYVFAVSAQSDTKYLAGAVPLVDGKVIFTRDIKVSSDVSEQKLFELVNDWANDEYKSGNDTKQRVLLSDPKERYVACQGDQKIVFSSGLFSLDQTQITYQLIVRVQLGLCDIEVRNIRYEYTDYDKPVAAEEMITDEFALNKNGTKLNRFYDKFRRSTINLVDSIRTSLLNNLGQISLSEIEKAKVISIVDTSSAPTIEQSIVSTETEVSIVKQGTAPTAPIAPAVSSQNFGNYKSIEADKIPGNIIKMLKDDWSLLVSGKEDNISVITDTSGGLGRIMEKPVFMSFINSSQHSTNSMNDGDTYTISFYTEMYRDVLKSYVNGSGKLEDQRLSSIQMPSGAIAFSEAWMIIECKKIITQPIAKSAIMDKELSDELGKESLTNIYVGEILNVWVK